MLSETLGELGTRVSQNTFELTDEGVFLLVTLGLRVTTTSSGRAFYLGPEEIID